MTPPHAPTAVRDAAAEHRLGLLLAGGAALLFGTSYIATKVALISYSPVAIGAWRGVGSFLVALVVLRAQGPAAYRVGREPERLIRLVVLGIFGGPAFVLGLNLGISHLGPTIAAFVSGLYAVLAAVIAPFLLRERLGVATLAGFVAALGGTVLLSELQLSGASAVGLAAGLGSAASYALYLVLSRRWGNRPGGIAPIGVVAAVIFGVTALVLVPIDLATDPGGLLPASPDPVAVLGILWLAVVPSVIANLMIQASVRRVAARRTASLLLLNPISAALLAGLLFGERLSVVQLAGAGLVIAGIAVSNGLVRLPRSAIAGAGTAG